MRCRHFVDTIRLLSLFTVAHADAPTWRQRAPAAQPKVMREEMVLVVAYSGALRRASLYMRVRNGRQRPQVWRGGNGLLPYVMAGAPCTNAELHHAPRSDMRAPSVAGSQRCVASVLNHRNWCEPANCLRFKRYRIVEHHRGRKCGKSRISMMIDHVHAAVFFAASASLVMCSPCSSLLHRNV